MDQNLDKESPEYLEALAQATEELEFCVNLCKSRVMMVTCFDISMSSAAGTQEGLREVEVWGQKKVEVEKEEEVRRQRKKKCSSQCIDSTGIKNKRQRRGERSFTLKQFKSWPPSYSASLSRTCKEKRSVSTNDVASMIRQWPSLIQKSMNDTWKCLFISFFFLLIIFHMVQVSSAYLSKPWTYCF